MDKRGARRPVLAIAAVTLVAALASVLGGEYMEVKLVATGIALLLVVAWFRARGMVSAWPETSGSGLPSRVMHPRSSSSRTPLLGVDPPLPARRRVPRGDRRRRHRRSAFRWPRSASGERTRRRSRAD